MELMQQKFSKSVMSYITLSLISIIAVALFSIFISFWVTELADNDARAINISGSIRMQTYHIALAMQYGDLNLAREYTQQLDKTWHNTLFSSQHRAKNQTILNKKFQAAFLHWSKILKPKIDAHLNFQKTSTRFHNDLFERQVMLTNAVVDEFQRVAEQKLRKLRSFQLIALFATIIVGSLIFHLLRNRVEKPLKNLTQTVYNFGKGDYRQRATVDGEDELSLLGEVFNQMSVSIEQSYHQLENRVEARTNEIQQKNTSLEFLFNTARKIIESHENNFDHKLVIDDLATILGVDNLELCLFTEQGEKPYMHIAQHENHKNDCSLKSCEGCKGMAPFSKLHAVRISERYPICKDNHQYGVISLTTKINEPLQAWQEQLLRSSADQFAIALSLEEQTDRGRRLAMLNERTVIARELHDSLAQALSYLQIQVTRLQKSHDKNKFDLQQPIIDELREGLSSAYRQLRELLTTFRLKMDNGGLRGALEDTVNKLKQRSTMGITLSYKLNDLPLSPTEEIHLLQIVREASQNSIHHSQGTHLEIKLLELSTNQVQLTISDNGIGIKTSPEKLNHYGLAIMNERCKHLGGEINICKKNSGGTEVEFTFMPAFRKTQYNTMATIDHAEHAAP